MTHSQCEYISVTQDKIKYFLLVLKKGINLSYPLIGQHHFMGQKYL
jgi:hypothetical protein